MCGFAGFVGKVEDRETVLVNMMDTIIHRGPDSAGKYVDEDAALGFRRLSIIDLSAPEMVQREIPRRKRLHCANRLFL